MAGGGSLTSRPSHSSRSRRDRRAAGSAWAERYPRTARVNEVLREVIADELERLEDEDERLRLTTVTGVETEPDLRHATVFVDSLSDARHAALHGQRVQLQAAIARQVRLKRTPRLSFEADPAVASGERVDSVLRRIHHREQGTARTEEEHDDG